MYGIITQSKFDDSAAHDLRPMPTFSASAESNVEGGWRACSASCFHAGDLSLGHIPANNIYIFANCNRDLSLTLIRLQLHERMMQKVRTLDVKRVLVNFPQDAEGSKRV